MTKGILKKPSPNGPNNGHSSSPPSHHLTWDEANIHWTEANKTSTMKIDEPKTPFVHASDIRLSQDDLAEEDGLPSLRLSADSTSNTHHHQSDYSDASAGCPRDSWQDSDHEADHLSGSEDSEAKERFLRLRKKHYDMKEGLRRGRELTASEAEDLEDQDVGDILNGKN